MSYDEAKAEALATVTPRVGEFRYWTLREMFIEVVSVRPAEGRVRCAIGEDHGVLRLHQFHAIADWLKLVDDGELLELEDETSLSAFQ